MVEEARNSVRRVRLPGFVVKEEVGLGDAITRMTSAVGVPACGGCHKRALSLDRRVRLYSARSDDRRALGASRE